MNTPEITTLDYDNPLHPTNIQTLVYQVQSVIKLLATNQDLTDVLDGETDTGTALIFTFMLLRDILDTVAQRLDELDMHYLNSQEGAQ